MEYFPKQEFLEGAEQARASKTSDEQDLESFAIWIFEVGGLPICPKNRFLTCRLGGFGCHLKPQLQEMGQGVKWMTIRWEWNWDSDWDVGCPFFFFACFCVFGLFGFWMLRPFAWSPFRSSKHSMRKTLLRVRISSWTRCLLLSFLVTFHFPHFMIGTLNHVFVVERLNPHKAWTFFASGLRYDTPVNFSNCFGLSLGSSLPTCSQLGHCIILWHGKWARHLCRNQTPDPWMQSWQLWSHVNADLYTVVPLLLGTFSAEWLEKLRLLQSKDICAYFLYRFGIAFGLHLAAIFWNVGSRDVRSIADARRVPKVCGSTSYRSIWWCIQRKDCFPRFFGPRCADGFEAPVSEYNVYVLSPNDRISPFSSLNELRVSSVVLKHWLGPEKVGSKQVWRVEACLFNPCRAAGMIQKQFTVSRCTEPKKSQICWYYHTIFLQFFVWKENFLGKSGVFCVCLRLDKTRICRRFYPGTFATWPP